MGKVLYNRRPLQSDWRLHIPELAVYWAGVLPVGPFWVIRAAGGGRYIGRIGIRGCLWSRAYPGSVLHSMAGLVVSRRVDFRTAIYDIPTSWKDIIWAVHYQFTLLDMALFKGLSFSLKRALGISGIKQKIVAKTGIPTTRSGLERKIGRTILKKSAPRENVNDTSLWIESNENECSYEQC